MNDVVNAGNMKKDFGYSNHREPWTTEETAKLLLLHMCLKRVFGRKRGFRKILVEKLERSLAAVSDRLYRYHAGEIGQAELKKIDAQIEQLVNTFGYQKTNLGMQMIVDYDFNSVTTAPGLNPFITAVRKKGATDVSEDVPDAKVTETPAAEKPKEAENKLYLVRLIDLAHGTVLIEEKILSADACRVEELCAYWLSVSACHAKIEVFRQIEVNVQLNVTAKVTED